MAQIKTCRRASDMKIMIDAGHGNNTAGKRSPYSAYKTRPALDFFEWRWNREIAARILVALKRKGYDAELVVTEDFDVKLIERVHRVNARCQSLGKENVICVSIHANAFGDGQKWNSAHGWSAYTSVGQTKSDVIAECLYDAAEKRFGSANCRYDRRDGDKDVEEQFYILKNTLCPAVLTENFFYTNISDTEFLLSEEGKQAIIDVHVEGIEKYLSRS